MQNNNMNLLNLKDVVITKIEEIINSFDYEYTNGYVEGVNNKIKTLKRVSCGMPDFESFRNRILLLLN